MAGFELHRPDRRRYTGSHRRRTVSGRMRLVIVFALLVGLNLYVFVFRRGTSVSDLLHTGAMAGARGDAVETVAAPVPPTPPKMAAEPAAGTELETVLVRGSMKDYVGLSAALAGAELTSAQIEEVVEALRGTLDMRALQPEHHFELRLDRRTRQVRTLAYHISPIVVLRLERQPDESLQVRRVEAPLDVRVERLSGTITSSLSQAMVAAGGSGALAWRLVELFSWDINWFTDPRPGDEFRILVQKKHLDDAFLEYGRILAAEYRGKVGRFEVHYFEREEGKGDYYTPEGRRVQRTFLKTPLRFRRISSRFNRRRFHPILHRTKGHFGVDYAAPRGTPIWAAADGTVMVVKRTRGAGNMVSLRHGGGVKTIYMHLHRFARGLKRGQRVAQRQVIGYVGSTGLATGPHLHYGMYVHGRPIDPQRFKVPEGTPLPTLERERFLAEVAERRTKLEAVALKQ